MKSQESIFLPESDKNPVINAECKSIYSFSPDNSSVLTNPKIGIIIPAYNEEENIANVLSNITKNNSKELEIIVIDDGSIDETFNIVKNFNVIVIHHQNNRGYGAAVKSGINFCKGKQYDGVVILDGDGQHDPSFIKKMVAPILNKETDFVIGNRFSYHYRMSTIRKLLSKIICAFYLFILRKKISDPTNGFRALSPKVLNYLNLESDYSISQEMLLKILPVFKFKEVPIKVYNRENGQSFITIPKYFGKMFLFIIKYYIFPKIRKISEKLLSEETRTFIGKIILKT